AEGWIFTAVSLITIGRVQCLISKTFGNTRLEPKEEGFWYKQCFGVTPTVNKGSNKKVEFHRKLGNNRHFLLNDRDGRNYLQISKVKQSDSSVYHCILSFWTETIFLRNVTVIVVVQAGGSRTSKRRCASRRGRADPEVQRPRRGLRRTAESSLRKHDFIQYLCHPLKALYKTFEKCFFLFRKSK
uniref:Ig-like domain-containing protein n=1 Tax=Neogobius melanostomus TaxID=47308 RepID=A0A8C6T1N7_9GOBI